MKAIQKFKTALARRRAARGAAKSKSSWDEGFNPAQEKAKAEEIEALEFVELAHLRVASKQASSP